MKIPKAKEIKSRNRSEKVKKLPHGQAKGPNSRPTKVKAPMKCKPHS